MCSGHGEAKTSPSAGAATPSKQTRTQVFFSNNCNTSLRTGSLCSKPEKFGDAQGQEKSEIPRPPLTVRVEDMRLDGGDENAGHGISFPHHLYLEPFPCH